MNIALSDHAWSTWHWATRLQCSIFALALVALVVGQTAIGQEQHPELPIWPKGLPKGAVVFDADKAKELIEATKVHPKGHILFVDTPTLTVYRAPRESANGSAVVICPGGGYNLSLIHI